MAEASIVPENRGALRMSLSLENTSPLIHLRLFSRNHRWRSQVQRPCRKPLCCFSALSKLSQ